MSSRTKLLKFTDATLGATLCRALRTLYLLRGYGGPPPDPTAVEVSRILVIRPGGMGDMIILAPFLRLLQGRYPDAQIDVVCEERNLPVLKLFGLAVMGLPYDRRPLRFLRILKNRTYDLSVDTEQFHHFSAIFSALGGAPVRIGFKLNPLRNPAYTHLINYDPDAKERDQFARLFVPLGIDVAPASHAGVLAGGAFVLPKDTAAEMAELASSTGCVAFHIGCAADHKCWPIEKFGEVMRRVHREFGSVPVLLGGERDRHASADIVEALRADGVPALSFAGQLPLPASAGVLANADLFVGGDSGLAHLAVAMGKRTVVIFGPSDHVKWGSGDPAQTVISKGLPCAPCFLFGFHKPCRARPCLETISVEEVVAACRRDLASRGATRPARSSPPQHGEASSSPSPTPARP